MGNLHSGDFPRLTRSCGVLAASFFDTSFVGQHSDSPCFGEVRHAR
jgi:hypothetical protein